MKNIANISFAQRSSTLLHAIVYYLKYHRNDHAAGKSMSLLALLWGRECIWPCSTACVNVNLQAYTANGLGRESKRAIAYIFYCFVFSAIFRCSQTFACALNANMCQNKIDIPLITLKCTRLLFNFVLLPYWFYIYM